MQIPVTSTTPLNWFQSEFFMDPPTQRWLFQRCYPMLRLYTRAARRRSISFSRQHGAFFDRFTASFWTSQRRGVAVAA